MLTLHSWSQLARESMNPLLTRQVIHGVNLTMARLELAQGAAVPLHSHLNEQFTFVVSGRLRFLLEDGAVIEVGAGEVLEIPPHVPHAVETLEDTVAIDVFAPPREDWQRGDDGYLRR
jgi:quercetin dioxygenase-like cupin family protein